MRIRGIPSWLVDKSADTFVHSYKIKSMETPDEKKFYPKGAIAFFIALILLSLAFWYGIYFLMIDRT